MPSKPLRTAAIAILSQKNRFLLQLRDDIPTILYPGQWALFGGHFEKGETAEEAIKREIWEEINYNIIDFKLFALYSDENAYRYVFHAPLTVPLSQLNQQEGWDMALIDREKLQTGHCYSSKARQYRPLALVHQKILLDFLKSRVK